MRFDLTNKNALVCGSTQGIGKAIAIQLASHGANITLFARNETSLKRAISDLPASGGQKHNYLVADFFDTEKVKNVVENAVSRGAFFHILVNNTGGPAHGSALDAGGPDFLKGFNAHLINNQNLVKALAPGMKKEGFGRIINVISVSVKTPIQGLGVSNTIRGAVASWGKTLANELGPFGITVNNILPGFTSTARLDELFQKRAEEAGITHEEYTQQAIQKIPARRLAHTNEMGYAAVFLASAEAGYINGINLPVDGGLTPTL